MQRMTDPVRVLAEGSDHELDDCAGDTLRQSSELSLR